jgi:hypothetical protein
VGTGLINLCIILKVGDVTESENPCTEGWMCFILADMKHYRDFRRVSVTGEVTSIFIICNALHDAIIIHL